MPMTRFKIKITITSIQKLIFGIAASGVTVTSFAQIPIVRPVDVGELAPKQAARVSPIDSKAIESTDLQSVQNQTRAASGGGPRIIAITPPHQESIVSRNQTPSQSNSNFNQSLAPKSPTVLSPQVSPSPTSPVPITRGAFSGSNSLLPQFEPGKTLSTTLQTSSSAGISFTQPPVGNALEAFGADNGNMERTNSQQGEYSVGIDSGYDYNSPMIMVDAGSDGMDSYDSCGVDCGDSSCESCSTNLCNLDGIGGRLRPSGQLRGRLRSRIAGIAPNICGGVFHHGFDQCGYISNANRYLQLDALYWTRGDGGIVGTNFGGPGDYPYNWGWRATMGWRTDAINGYEATYFGFLPFDRTVNQTSAAAAIDARFLPADGFGATQTSAFYNSIATTQQLQTRFHSAELSRVRFGWDVVKTSMGMRYMWLDDQYQLSSLNNVGDTGTFSMKANNHLIGPDVGLELLYDVGRRISFSGKVKGGAYVDIYQLQTRLTNNGTQFLGNENNSTNLAASMELGANAYYRLGPNTRLRGGYDALWLYNVMSVSENFPAYVTPVTGFNPDDSRNVNLHGASFGIEFYR